MQIYVDESKAKAYLIVAVIIAPGQAAGFRKRMKKLCMPGQGHIHFVNEKDSRRKQILDQLADMKVKARVYSVSGLNPIAARPLLLDRLMSEIQHLKATLLVLERDDSVIKTDVAFIRQGLLSRGLSTKVEYRHVARSQESLLWIADAIAWSYARGGDYRKRALQLIESLEKLPGA